VVTDLVNTDTKLLATRSSIFFVYLNKNSVSKYFDLQSGVDKFPAICGSGGPVGEEEFQKSS
jgi:hypothetical protein